MHEMRIALSAGLILLVLAVGATLLRAPPAVLASNAVPTAGELVAGWTNASGCQAGERVPAGTRAIRLSLAAISGPKVTVRAYSGTTLVTSGETGSDWTGRTLTVHVRPIAKAVTHATICFATAPNREGVGIYGSNLGGAAALRTTQGKALPVRMTIEYLGNGRSSWLALASSVARHMAFGRAWSGIWVVYLVIALMLAAATLASRALLRELDK